MFSDLRGKRTLITGASRGLGVYIARTLAKEGAELLLTARDGAKLEAVAAECRGLGGGAAVIPADLLSAEGRAKLCEQAGAVDVLINNAGYEHPVRLIAQSDAQVAQQLETNLIAPIDLARRLLPGMLERKQGVVVNISSMSGKGATPYNAIYSATKYGLNGFTASLAIELEGSGVHAGVVCPGFVSGDGMWASTGLPAPAMMREVPPERVAAAVREVIGGARQVLVTPMPVRPLLALAQLFPGIEPAFLRVSGVLRTLASRSERLLQGGQGG
jgi:short-subunit dehydrogenase